MTFPEDCWVEVRYPLTSEQERGPRRLAMAPGWVVSHCGPGQWEICVQAPELAGQHQGQTVFPVCFRDSCELGVPAAELGAGQ
jgi:hypothetical protein